MEFDYQTAACVANDKAGEKEESKKPTTSKTDASISKGQIPLIKKIAKNPIRMNQISKLYYWFI